MHELTVRILFAIILFSVFSIGFYHRIKANRQKDRFSRMKNEGSGIFLVLRIVGFSLWIICLLYPLFPGIFRPFTFRENVIVQITGMILAVGAIPMGYAVFTSIGKNITDTVETRKNHQLITTGIYRYIRHPLYTTGFLFFIGLGLLSSNWLVILLSCLVLVALVIRTQTEEEELIKLFGDQYIEYRKTTGKFFPKLFQ